MPQLVSGTLEHSHVRAHIYHVRNRINHDCIHRRIRQRIRSRPGKSVQVVPAFVVCHTCPGPPVKPITVT